MDVTDAVLDAADKLVLEVRSAYLKGIVSRAMASGSAKLVALAVPPLGAVWATLKISDWVQDVDPEGQLDANYKALGKAIDGWAGAQLDKARAENTQARWDRWIGNGNDYGKIITEDTGVAWEMTSIAPAVTVATEVVKSWAEAAGKVATAPSRALAAVEDWTANPPGWLKVGAGLVVLGLGWYLYMKAQPPRRLAGVEDDDEDVEDDEGRPSREEDRRRRDNEAEYAAGQDSEQPRLRRRYTGRMRLEGTHSRKRGKS